MTFSRRTPRDVHRCVKCGGERATIPYEAAGKLKGAKFWIHVKCKSRTKAAPSTA